MFLGISFFQLLWVDFFKDFVVLLGMALSVSLFYLACFQSGMGHVTWLDLKGCMWTLF